MGLCIRGARIGTSSEDFVGDVLIEGETIVKVAPGGLSQEEYVGAEVIPAEDMVLLPGGVDPHTHFDLDVGFARTSDTFFTGSLAAACGGTTTVVDHMAFGPAGCKLGHQVEVYHGLAKDAVVDYGFHGVLQHVDADVLADMETLLHTEGISSYKAYMTYDYRLEDGALLQVLRRAKELGMVICAHCENDGIIRQLREECKSKGQGAPRFHALTRPPEAEAEAVLRFLMLSRLAGYPDTYVVHLSSALGLKAARFARSLPQPNLWLETCPQYLFLDDRLYTEDAAGLRPIMSPPLRKAEDQRALWEGLQTGEMSTIGTDHCTFTDAQKARGAGDFTLCPNGGPGVELRMPLLFSEGVMAGRITLPQMVRLCCTKPAEIFGIAPQKGDIAPGADADLVLFDPSLRWTVAREKLHANVDYSLYEGRRLQGKPVMTLSRGEVIVREGIFCGQKGRGRYLRRKGKEGSGTRMEHNP